MSRRYRTPGYTWETALLILTAIGVPALLVLATIAMVTGSTR